MRCALAALAALPLGAARFLARRVADLAFCLLRVRRRHVEGALARAGLGGADLAHRTYRSLALAFVDGLWAARSEARRRALVAVDDALAARLADARRARRPVVLAASHTGSWELALAEAARHGEVLALVRRVSAPALDRAVNDLRARAGVAVARPDEAPLARALVHGAQGGIVVALLDQAPPATRRAPRGAFLGAAARLDPAPARIAARLGAELLVVGTRFERPLARHVVHLLAAFEPSSEPSSEPSTPSDADARTRAANEALEAFVRARPTCWLWLHRRWRGGDAPAPPPPALAAPDPVPCGAARA